MKLKSKSFNLMQRTDALLKMLATAKGVTETEIIEEALEQFADENILTFINSMYGEKVDRDTIRADRKRNTKNKKIESKVVTLEEENIKNEDNFKSQAAITTVDEPKEEVVEVEQEVEQEVVENKNDFDNEELSLSFENKEIDSDYISIRDAILQSEKENEEKVSESKDTKENKVLSLETVSKKALDIF